MRCGASSLALISLFCVSLAADARAAEPAHNSEETRPFRRHDYKQTFKKPYYYNHTIPFWETSGNAIPSTDYIRLASSVPGMKGSIWATAPNKHPEWEAELSFIVSGRGNAGGKGLALWYSKERAKEGPVFGSVDKWDGLGVFFDTFDETTNRNSPLVYGVINDGNKEVATVKNPDDVKFGSCWRDYRNPSVPVFVRVTYLAKKLSIAVDTIQKGKSYISCFEAHDIALPTGYHFGLSALSADLADDHDVISFDLYELNPKKATEHPLRPHEKEKIDKGQEFNVTEEAKKHIEQVENKVEEMRHKEDELKAPSRLTAAVADHLEEAQFRIIESLNAVHSKLESLGAPAKPHEALGDVDKRLTAMSASITSLSIEIKSLHDIVSSLVQHVGESKAGSTGSASDHLFGKVHDAVQDIKTKLEIQQNRFNGDGSQQGGHAPVVSSIAPYAIVFFVCQAALMWFFSRRKVDGPKKFI